MKYSTLLPAVVLIAILACRSEKPTQNNKSDSIPEPAGWKLVWNDEFKNTGIDLTKWEHEVNAWGGGNNELQYYTSRSQNSYIKDGALVIQAIRETFTGPEGTRSYTSARLRTKNKGDWKYGRFEIRAKFPRGKGLWPAIWMLPTQELYGGWAGSGEIDITEYLGHEINKVYGTLHYGGPWPQNVHSGQAYVLPTGNFADNYHIFALEWEPTIFRWYVDGILYQTQTKWHSSGGPYPAPFDQKFHLLLNLAVGGNWPGNPDETTTFPQQMTVDYVRIFTRIGS